MHSSSPPLQLNISRSVTFMSLSAMPGTAKGRGTGTWFTYYYLDKSDSKSTSNLCKHAKICFGQSEVASADKTQDVHAACKALKNMKDGSITEAFKHVAKLKVTYSHRQHMTTESHYVSIPHCSMTDLTMNDRAEIIWWVAESKQPFQIVNNHGFQSLMKTRRPEYHIPSMQTVSHDVKWVFVQVCKHIAKMLQVRFTTKKHKLTCNRTMMGN